jgi:hypothetical protein
MNVASGPATAAHTGRISSRLGRVNGSNPRGNEMISDFSHLFSNNNT